MRIHLIPAAWRPKASSGLVAIAVLLLFTFLSTAFAGEDEVFLSGLRQRRLFTLAEAYCRDRLAQPKLTEADRAAVVIEYMLTLSQHAIYSPPDAREKLWQEARKLSLQIKSDHPRKLVVDLQAALVTLAQGELARQEAEAANATTEQYAPAQKFLRAATGDLEALEKAIAQAIATRREPSPKGALTADEQFALQHNVRYQLSRARRNQGLCYPAGSDDRVAALAQAIEQLDKLRTQLADDEPLMWRVKLDQGLCARLLGRSGEAKEVFEALLEPVAPLVIQQQARAELARIELARNQPAAALKLIDAGRTSAELTSPELEFALLETYVALWKQAADASDTQNAGRYRQQSVEQLAAIEKSFGVYWSRRGEWLVIGSAGGDDESLEIVARSADARFLKGQFDDETLKLYDQGAKLASAAGNWSRYLALAFRAATVEQRRDNLQVAGERMVKLGQVVADRVAAEDELYRRAGVVHLQGVRLLEQAAIKQRPSLAVGVRTWYEEHLQLWPQQATADDARIELGRLYEQLNEPAQAVDCYRAVKLDHPRFPEALDGLARAWAIVLDTDAQTAKKVPDDRAMRDAAKFYRGLIAPANEPLPRQFTAQQRQIALAGARLLLLHTKTGYAAAEELLVAALDGSADAPAQWRNAAQSLAVVALAAQPRKQAEAEQLIAQLGANNPRELLEMLHGLTTLSRTAGDNVRRDLAKLQLRAIELLKPQMSQLEAPQRTALAMIEATALAASGQRDLALAAYEKVLKTNPNSGALQVGYADLLSSGGDKPSWEKGLTQWRIIAQASKPQSERWWQAKYQVALLSYKLGDKAQAAKLIRYLQVTPPGLAASSLEKEFLALLKQCE